jgi:bla regulator protein BlaR1
MSWLLAFGLKNAILALPLAALALAASRWLKRPALAHLLWAIVLVKLITPPLIEVPVGWQLDVESWLGGSQPANAPLTGLSASDRAAGGARQRDSAQRRESRAGAASRNASIAARRPAHDGASAAPRQHGTAVVGIWFGSRAAWQAIVGLIWAVGSLWLVALFLWRAWRFHRYLRWATGRNEYLGPRVAELAHSVGIAIPPRVIVVDGMVSPMLWGLGQRACLIFPSQLLGRLSPANLDSLLLHELAHYWRGDHWIRALELGAYILFWWNPVVWWALREIEAAEEECCDAWVVEHQRGTRHSYAEALLTTIDFLCERPESLPPVACGLGEVQLLRVRLTQIVRGDVAAGVSRWLQMAVIAGGLVISPLEPALWATSHSVTKRPAAGPFLRRSATPLVSSTAPPPLVAPNRRSAEKSPGRSAVADSGMPAASRILPALPRPAITHWGTAVSPDRRHRLEARSGGRIMLAGMPGSFRVDLSAHQIRCVSFSPDSSIFATGHPDALVRLWESESGGLKKSLQGSQAPITSVHISPDGSQVAAGASDGSVLVWEIDSGDLVAHLPPGQLAVSCLRWSPRGDRLAVTVGSFVDRSDSSLLIWNPSESATVLQQSLNRPAGAISWTNEGALLVADWSGQATLLDMDTGEIRTQRQVDKTSVSAAAWSADCPLVLRHPDDSFLIGAQP